MSTAESYEVSTNGSGEAPAVHGDATEYNLAPPLLAAPISSYHAGDGSAAEVSPAVTGEKKRGRQRKHPVEEREVPILALPAPEATPASNGKRKGRPPGSKTKPKVAPMGSPAESLLNTAFTPHIMIVQPGVDIAAKVMSFLQNGWRTICVLSAVGIISNVTLCQANSSGGTVTYEGRFEIVSLTGSYTVLESGVQRGHSGGLRILLVGSDEQLFGGGVAGHLIAGAPVQVVLGAYSLGQE